MQITGRLAECPWDELLNLIERLRLSGCLQVRSQGILDQQQVGSSKLHQLWFEQGVLLGASRASRTNSLFWLMQHQGWVSYTTAQQIAKCCPQGMAIGQHFRQQKVLTELQLQQLFRCQTLATLHSLSQLQAGEFHLDTEEPLPYDRLTGLRLSLYDAIALMRQAQRSALAHSPSQPPPSPPLAAKPSRLEAKLSLA